MPNRRLNVFLCHAKEDKPTVRELYRQLTAEGWMDVWLDEENLFPGQEWDMEIEKAVEAADVVIVCLSSHSVDKEGYVQKELRFVLNIADEKPEGTIFVVPVRLDECQVPRRIRAWQYVDYFPKSNRKRAYQRLLESLKKRAGKLGIPYEKPAPLVEDETAKAEHERKSKEEREQRERLAAQKADSERIAREKAEAERAAKAERDRLARQKADERRKAMAEAFRKIYFKRILTIGGIGLAMVALFFIGRFAFENLPTIPAPPPALQTSPTPELGVGSTWISPKDGMVMMFVPAGKFSMGSDSGSDDEKPVHDVTLDSYWMDKTEVTNAMYAKCAQDGSCAKPSDTKRYGNSNHADHPVVYVSWNDAKAYCDWRGDGTRLPTETEWEKAAGWDDDRKKKHVYPWGDIISCSIANYRGKAGACVGDTTKIGSYPSGASFYGLLDMAGNVKEWVSSLYQSYPYNATDGREDFSALGSRVLRGGSWMSDEGYLRVSYRDWNVPDDSYSIVGFRCVRSP